MKALLLSIPFVLVMALIVYTLIGASEGPVNGFEIVISGWNCLPVAVGLATLLVGLRLQGAPAAALITFAVIGAALPALFHLAWLFDWGGTATGSSTSALAFLFIPFWVIVAAVVLAGVSWCIARGCSRPGPSSKVGPPPVSPAPPTS